MNIVFTGGGTLGSVMPLIAIWEELKERDTNLTVLWLSTSFGPEHAVLEKYEISYRPIQSAKWRRYFSLKNFLTPFVLLIGFVQSFFMLKKFRPRIVVSAGGFVGVPVVLAAYALKIPSIIHQQDIRVGLANKLSAPAAARITTAFETSLRYFPQHKTIHMGNPVRMEIFQSTRGEGLEFFQFTKKLPVALIMGGGTGARALNTLVLGALEELMQFCQVIHLTGLGKQDVIARHSNYRYYELLTEGMSHAYAAADLVVCRAGMSTLTEVAALCKPTIVIPLPFSHQVDNAVYFAKNNAVLSLDQNLLTPKTFSQAIHEVLHDRALEGNLKRNLENIMPHDATQRMVELILKLSSSG